MKLVSLLCLILGTACITTEVDPQARDGVTLELDPDLESTGRPSAEPAAHLQSTTGMLDPNTTGAVASVDDEGPANLPPEPGAEPYAFENPSPSASPACSVDDDCAADENCITGTCARPCGIDGSACGDGGSCFRHFCLE